MSFQQDAAASAGNGQPTSQNPWIFAVYLAVKMRANQQ